MEKWLVRGIYAIVNKLNGKRYVGSGAMTVKKRHDAHLRDLLKGKGTPHLQAAFDKYGRKAFKFVVLEIVPEGVNIYEREQYWIDYYVNKYGRSILYNISLTAGGGEWAEETKEKMRGNQNAKGNKHTKEFIEKIRGKMKERWSDPELRKNASEKMKDKIPWNKGLTEEMDRRVKLSEEAKESLKGNQNWRGKVKKAS